MTAANTPQTPKSATRATNGPGVGVGTSVSLTDDEREFLRAADLGRKFRMNELHIARVESLIAARVDAALTEVERRIEGWRGMAEWAAINVENVDQSKAAHIRARAYNRAAGIVRDYREGHR